MYYFYTLYNTEIEFRHLYREKISSSPSLLLCFYRTLQIRVTHVVHPRGLHNFSSLFFPKKNQRRKETTRERERETKGKYLLYNVLKIRTSYFDDRCTDKQVYMRMGRFFAREKEERKKKQQQQSWAPTMTNIYIFIYVRRIHTNFDVSIMDGRE